MPLAVPTTRNSRQAPSKCLPAPAVLQGQTRSPAPPRAFTATWAQAKLSGSVSFDIYLFRLRKFAWLFRQGKKLISVRKRVSSGSTGTCLPSSPDPGWTLTSLEVRVCSSDQCFPQPRSRRPKRDTQGQPPPSLGSL